MRHMDTPLCLPPYSSESTLSNGPAFHTHAPERIPWSDEPMNQTFKYTSMDLDA